MAKLIGAGGPAGGPVPKFKLTGGHSWGNSLLGTSSFMNRSGENLFRLRDDGLEFGLVKALGVTNFGPTIKTSDAPDFPEYFASNRDYCNGQAVYRLPDGRTFLYGFGYYHIYDPQTKEWTTHNRPLFPWELRPAEATDTNPAQPRKTYGPATTPGTHEFFMHGQLPDGRVIIIGGEVRNDVATYGDNLLGDAGIWDPATNTWSFVTVPNWLYIGSDAVYKLVPLADGRLIGLCSYRSVDYTWDPVGLIWVTSEVFYALIFNPLTGTFSKTSSYEAVTAGPWGSEIGGGVAITKMQDDRVFFLGGWNGTASDRGGIIWDPVSDSWTKADPTGTCPIAQNDGSYWMMMGLTTLPSGKIIAVGGDSDTVAGSPTQDMSAYALVYDPVTMTWGAPLLLAYPRSRGHLTLNVSGYAVTFGGEPWSYFGSPASWYIAEVYDEGANVLRTVLNSPPIPLSYFNATKLTDGKFLFLGTNVSDTAIIGGESFLLESYQYGEFLDPTLDMSDGFKAFTSSLTGFRFFSNVDGAPSTPLFSLASRNRNSLFTIDGMGSTSHTIYREVGQYDAFGAIYHTTQSPWYDPPASIHLSFSLGAAPPNDLLRLSAVLDSQNGYRFDFTANPYFWTEYKTLLSLKVAGSSSYGLKTVVRIGAADTQDPNNESAQLEFGSPTRGWIGFHYTDVNGSTWMGQQVRRFVFSFGDSSWAPASSMEIWPTHYGYSGLTNIKHKLSGDVIMSNVRAGKIISSENVRGSSYLLNGEVVLNELVPLDANIQLTRESDSGDLAHYGALSAKMELEQIIPDGERWSATAPAVGRNCVDLTRVLGPEKGGAIACYSDPSNWTPLSINYLNPEGLSTEALSAYSGYLNQCWSEVVVRSYPYQHEYTRPSFAIAGGITNFEDFWIIGGWDNDPLYGGTPVAYCTRFKEELPGQLWAQLRNLPYPIAQPIVAADPVNHRLAIFGGYSSAWVQEPRIYTFNPDMSYGPLAEWVCPFPNGAFPVGTKAVYLDGYFYLFVVQCGDASISGKLIRISADSPDMGAIGNWEILTGLDGGIAPAFCDMFVDTYGGRNRIFILDMFYGNLAINIWENGVLTRFDTGHSWGAGEIPPYTLLRVDEDLVLVTLVYYRPNDAYKIVVINIDQQTRTIFSPPFNTQTKMNIFGGRGSTFFCGNLDYSSTGIARYELQGRFRVKSSDPLDSSKVMWRIQK